jgi:cell wall-associated NlpC family hydrolase
MTEQTLDPRINAYRGDIASASLKGKVEAERFVAPTPMSVTTPLAPMHKWPAADARCTNETWFGELVDVYDLTDGWAWCQAAREGYVGYVRADALTDVITDASHRLAVPASHLYPEPDMKSAPAEWLPFGARLTVMEERRGFSRVADGRWAVTRHLLPLGAVEPDIFATALKFQGVPYLWGGGSAAGFDCSGLIQVALLNAGQACPRDSSQMAAALGRALADDTDPTTLARGDLVFFPGHVMIADGQGNVLHANAHHMAVALEPVEVVRRRCTPKEADGWRYRRVETAVAA